MKPRKIAAVYLWPAAMALLTLIGLLAALIGDEAWDRLSWVTLGIPTGLCVWIVCGAPRFYKRS